MPAQEIKFCLDSFTIGRDDFPLLSRMTSHILWNCDRGVLEPKRDNILCTWPAAWRQGTGHNVFRDTAI